ncbi:3-dehydroquinate synthase [Candidatus Peregrinibacteria bacterium]|jgi:3-dehydroquinate synthase|nr:3-dehydroquinate synthase [Candidatus Peregrinibacteria bacterium]MBT7736948.1 3-dehydroquinate synthase [Candidatus Peregrinibacteria bacterium]
MAKVATKLKKRINDSYRIIIEKNISRQIPQYLEELELGKKYAIITDTIVEKLFAKKLQNALKRKKIKSEIFVIKKGETSKTLKTVEEVAIKMIEKGIDRHDAVIALGGGVVGDIAGFVAAIYMRGIPYIQVPTTLLAMVDSAVGGKTGVDLPVGKNLIGTITQPKAVFIDIAYLKGLPDKQVKSGLSEIIKYGVIKSKRLFKYIEKNLDDILKKDEEALKHIIKESIRIKTKIVEKDEQEGNLRMILNYGHTYGHALEKLSGYKLLHGFAISVGMVIMNKIAVERGLLKQKHSDRITELLKRAGLPTTALKTPTKKQLLGDKKKQGDYINFVLPVKIGKAVIQPEKCL